MSRYEQGSEYDQTLQRINGIGRSVEQKSKTYSRLLASIEQQEKKARFGKVLNSITISSLVLLMLAIGLFYSSSEWISEWGTGALPSTTVGDHSLHMNPTDFTIETGYDGTWVFIGENERVIGGLEILTYEEMSQALLAKNLFENESLDEFPYQTTRTLAHIKSMDITQTIHYYFKMEEEDRVYDLFFHTPYFSKERAYEIAQSFKVE